LPSLLLSRLSRASFCWSASYSLWSLSMPRSRLWVPDTRRDRRLACCLSAAAAALASAGVAAAAGAATAGAGLDATPGAARMLLGQRTERPAAVVAVPLGAELPLAGATLGCVAVRARPNARATLGFWTPLLSVDNGADGCLAADLVSTPVRCCCCCCCAVGVALPALPALDTLVVYLGVLTFSLSVAALLGVALGFAFLGACCSQVILLVLAEAGLNAGR
jgi:hypothetical protein